MFLIPLAITVGCVWRFQRDCANATGDWGYLVPIMMLPVYGCVVLASWCVYLAYLVTT